MIKEQQQRLSIGLHYSRSVVIPLGNNSGIFDELFDDLLQYEEQEVQGEYEKYFSLPTENRQTDCGIKCSHNNVNLKNIKRH